jgi:dynein heavy chain, axonemal
MERLEETQVTLGSFATTRYAVPFKMAISDWANRLAVTIETLEQWLAVQVSLRP